MKFIVSRTSFLDEEKPCEDAFAVEATYIDRRSVKTIKEARESFQLDGWFENGINHREEDGGVVCDRKEKSKLWCIEIKSLDEMIEFCNKHGDIIISKTDCKEILHDIEIYDYYRE